MRWRCACPPTARSPKRRLEGGRVLGATVLLVDDEERILAALERTLRREGYRLLRARSGDEALRLLDAEPVDAILSDHKMPGPSGLELLERAAARWPGTARILISGWPEEIAADRMRALGIHALVPKPWDARQLRSTLREVLGAR